MRYIDIKKEFNCKTNSDMQWLRLKLRWFSLIHMNGGRCIKCGESNFNCLEFHHRDPNAKDNQISYLIMGYGKGGWDSAKKEVSKCDLICRNCHYEIHNNAKITKKKNMLFDIINRDSCEICFYGKKQCLDFHHKHGKDFTIGKSNSCNDREALKKELIKCQVVCKNCHKKIHVNKDRWDRWGNLIMSLSKEYDNLGMSEYIDNIVHAHSEVIKELYWMGDTIRGIMKYLGIENRSSIRVHFNKSIEGLGLVRKPKEVNKRYMPLKNIGDDTIIQLWNDTSIKYIKDIAKELGVSIDILNARMRKLRKKYDNLLDRKEFVKQFSSEYKHSPKKRIELNEVEKRMIELRGDGKTAKEVAEVVGMTPIAVRKRYSKLIKMGIIEAIPKEFSNH